MIQECIKHPVLGFLVGLQGYSAEEFNGLREELQQAVVVVASGNLDNPKIVIEDLERAVQFVKDIQKFKEDPKEKPKSSFIKRLEDAQRQQEEQRKNRSK